MTIEKDIEILTDELNTEETFTDPDFQHALKQSTEALKRYKVIRANFGKLREDQLPGETQDGKKRLTMIPDKAIRRLEHYLKLGKPEPIDNFNAAVQLGIEGLKAILTVQYIYPDWPVARLPGETND